MKKIITITIAIILNLFILNNAFALENKDWDCNNNEKVLYKCTQSEFFDKRSKNLINKNKELDKNQIDNLLNALDNYEVDKIYSIDEYQAFLETFISTNLEKTIESNLVGIKGKYISYVNYVIYEKLYKNIRYFTKLVGEQDKSTFIKKSEFDALNSKISELKLFLNDEFKNINDLKVNEYINSEYKKGSKFKCTNIEVNKFWECDEKDFFYDRIKRLTIKSNLTKEEKDSIINEALNRKNLGFFNRDEYKTSLYNLINYQATKLIEDLSNLTTYGGVDSNYYNNVFLPKFNSSIKDFVDYIFTQNKETLESNPYLEEFDSPIPGLKKSIRTELQVAYYNNINKELNVIFNDGSISLETLNLLDKKYYNMLYGYNSENKEIKSIYEEILKDLKALKQKILDNSIKKDLNQIKPNLPKVLKSRLIKAINNTSDDKKEFVLMKLLRNIDLILEKVKSKNDLKEIEKIEILLGAKEIIKNELEKFN